MTAFKNAKTEIPENPARLRDCLNALAAACGHDVFRVEVTTTVSKTKGESSCLVLVTSSRQDSEHDIAKVIVHELARFMGLNEPTEPK